MSAATSWFGIALQPIDGLLEHQQISQGLALHPYECLMVDSREAPWHNRPHNREIAHAPHPRRPARAFMSSRSCRRRQLTLGKEQSLYLAAVLRKAVGDEVVLFNGRDGAWLAGSPAMPRSR